VWEREAVRVREERERGPWPVVEHVTLAAGLQAGGHADADIPDIDTYIHMHGAQ
jgi:hypothetical protein